MANLGNREALGMMRQAWARKGFTPATAKEEAQRMLVYASVPCHDEAQLRAYRRSAWALAEIATGETADPPLAGDEILRATEGAFDFAFRNGDLYVEQIEGAGLVFVGHVGDDQRVREAIAMLRENGREV